MSTPIDGDPFAGPEPLKNAAKPQAPGVASDSGSIGFDSEQNAGTPIEGDPTADFAPNTYDIPFPLPPALLKRFVLGSKTTEFFKAMGEGAVAGWGTETLGFSDKNVEALRKLGIFRDPERGDAYSPLRLANEAILQPAAAGADALIRGFKAGTYALAAGGAELVYGSGLGDAVLPGGEARLKRDLVILADMSMLLTGQQVTPRMMTRVRRDAMGRTFDENIGTTLPTENNIKEAARAVTGDINPVVEGKVKQIYQERGILPAEAVADAAEDIVTKQDLLSTTPKLPERYVPGGGQPPEPPVIPPKDTVYPNPKGPNRPVYTPDDVKAASDYMDAKISVGEQPAGHALTWKRFYTNFVDQLYPIKTDTAVGRALEVYEDPYALGRLYAGWTAKADYMIRFNTFDFNTLKNNGMGFKDIISPFKNDLQPFRRFITAARAGEMEVRGFKSGFDWDKIETVVNTHRSKEFVDRFELLVDYQNRTSQMLRDSGIISDKAYDAMTAQNRLFVPFHQVAELNFSFNQRGGTMQATNPLKKLEGADMLRVTDPLETIVKNTFVLTAMAERNNVGLRIVDRLIEAGALANKEVKPGTALVVKENKPLEVWNKAHGGDAPKVLVDELANLAVPVKEGEIAVYRKGKVEVWEVGEDLANAFKALDRDTLSTLEKVFAYPASTLRAGALGVPDFAAKHVFRDFFYALASTVKGVYTPIDTAKAFVGMLRKDADWQNWIKGGGGEVSIVSLDRQYLQRTLEDISTKTGLMTRAYNVVIDPNASWLTKTGAVAGLPFKAASRYVIHPSQMVTEFAMSLHHFAGYKKAIRASEKEITPAASRGQNALVGHNGGPPMDMTGQMVIREGVSVEEALRAASSNKKDILDAAFTARETSVDMARIGAKMHGWNMISAFANSKIQDVDKIARMFKDHPVRTGLIIGGGITIPSLLLAWATSGDSRVKDLPNWQKDTFWIIPTDKWEEAKPGDALNRPADQIRLVNGKVMVNNGIVFRVPKPFTLGVVFGSIPERLFRSYHEKDPRAMDDWMGSILGSAVGDLVPNAAAPMLEQAMNQRLFNGSTIIPQRYEKGLPEYQYTPYTTETAKAFGKVMSAFPGVREFSTSPDDYFRGGFARSLTSPALLENYVQGWTGSMGVYALKLLDLGLRKTGAVADPTKPDWTFADVPFVRAFVIRYPNATTQNISRFYEKYEVNERYMNSFRLKAAEGDIEAVQRIQAMGGPKIFLKLDGFKQALSSHYTAIRQINALTEKGQMKPYEARQIIDSLYFGLIQVGDEAAKALDVIDNIRTEKPSTN